MPSEFLSATLWSSLIDKAAAARRRLCAVAYVSADDRLRFREGDTLVTDATDGAIASGQTSAAVLRTAHERGVKIVSHKNFHAKVYVCDDWVLVGSANTSAHSRSMTEAAIASTDPGVIAEVTDWIAQLAKAGSRVTSRFLDRIESIPVVRVGYGPRSAKPTLLEAIEGHLPGLEDLCFGIYWGEADLKLTDVKAQAKAKGIVLPKGDHWTWFEDEYSSALQRLTRSRLGERGLVAFEVATHGEAVARFESLDETLFTFSDAIRVNKTLATVGDTRKPSPFRLDGSQSRELCARLTAGLRHHQDLAHALYVAPGGFVDVEKLQQLLGAA